MPTSRATGADDGKAARGARQRRHAGKAAAAATPTPQGSSGRSGNRSAAYSPAASRMTATPCATTDASEPGSARAAAQSACRGLYSSAAAAPQRAPKPARLRASFDPCTAIRPAPHPLILITHAAGGRRIGSSFTEGGGCRAFVCPRDAGLQIPSCRIRTLQSPPCRAPRHGCTPCPSCRRTQPRCSLRGSMPACLRLAPRGNLTLRSRQA